MSIRLIAWGRFFDKNGNKITVPAPVDGNGDPWLVDLIASKAPELAKSGFDDIQWPPLQECLGGAGAGCDGYGVRWRRSFKSRYSPTKELVIRAFASVEAAGMGNLLDIPLHQLMGENGGPGVFRYPGADGKTLNGRGATTPGWFRGNTGNNDPVPPFCREDDVPNVFYDYPFGREISNQNCHPHRVTIEDALDWGDWLFRTTGAIGARYDDVKGTWAQAVAEFMNSRAMADKEFYSEFFEGNPAILNNWATSSPMNSRSGVEDFTNHWAVQGATSSGNAHLLNGAGYTSWNPGLAYVFADNPDTDTSNGQQIISSKLLAYAFLLTVSARCVLVYGKDYFDSSVWPKAYGLKSYIDPLIKISRKFAYGKTMTQHIDGKVIALNRDGDGGTVAQSAGLLTAINFDTWNNREVEHPTSFGPNVELEDYTRRHKNIRTDSRGYAKYTIPANAYQNGQSFLCFSRAGQDIEPKPQSRTVSQTFFTADDLDVPSVPPHSTMTIGHIWSAANEPIVIAPHGPIAGLAFGLKDSAGSIVSATSDAHGVIHARAGTRGRYSLVVSSTNESPMPCTVQVKYRGLYGLTADEMAFGTAGFPKERATEYIAPVAHTREELGRLIEEIAKQ